MYLTAGVTDLYLETGERALLEALLRQWQDMVSHKLFITGGLGSRYEGEAFGDPYEIPPDLCYCETCAAIGSIFWNWRMLLATGEGRFADLIERTLYNSFLSGLALDGQNFFYVNPLLSRGGRRRAEWYPVACCPPNIMRLIASLGHYLATKDATGLQIHLYNPASLKTELASGHPIALTMETEYPWQGQVKLMIQDTDGAAWQLRLRVPGWCQSAQVTINGQRVDNPMSESGYIVLNQAWQPGDVIELTLAIEPQLIEAHPRLDAIRGSVAIQRGPLIYCLEEVETEVNLLDVRLDEEASLQATWEEGLLPEGIVVIETTGRVLNPNDWQDTLYRPLNSLGRQVAPSKAVRLKAIPYYAWANRGVNAMRVWIPKATAY
jgi:DUF1680 family protein